MHLKRRFELFRPGVIVVLLTVALSLAPHSRPLAWAGAPSTSSPAAATQSLARIDPLLLAAPPDRLQPFLILLRQQADLSGPLPAERSARIGEVSGRLRSVADASQAPLLAWLATRNVPRQPFHLVNAIAAIGDRGLIEALAARPEVARIEPDPSRRSALWPPAELMQQRRAAGLRPEDSIPDDGIIPWGVQRIGAPAAWNVYGVTGAGVVVGSIDSGVDWGHPALKAQYRGWDGDSADHNYNWRDAIGAGSEPYDDNDHGTHTTGTMVGQTSNLHIGVAPGARWIACKSMDGQGVGSASTFLECLQWMLEPTDLSGQNPDPGQAPHLVNNSWGCRPVDGCASDTLLTAVQNLRAAGIMLLASAGNGGPNCSTVNNPPGIYGQALSAGAFHPDGQILHFSSRGPVTADSSGRLKPNLAAPGWQILSSVPGGGYSDFAWSGTSMASAHVAGAVALVWQADPALIDDIALTEQVLQSSAEARGDNDGCGGDTPGQVPNNRWGYGALSALAAVQTVLGEASVRGGVTDANSGDPLVGAHVTLIDTETQDAYEAIAGADGSYGLYLPAAVYDIEAGHLGYQTQTLDDYAISPGAQVLLDFALFLPGPLAGAVADLDSGLPLANAGVEVTPQAGGPALHTATDAAGYYEVLLNEGAYDVTASATDHLSATVSGVLIQGSMTTTLDFQLQGVGALAGTVVQAGSGQPLAGAQLQAWRAGAAPVQWTTGAGGSYSRLLPQGVYTVSASFAQHETALIGDVAVQTGAETVQAFALYPVGTVRGRLRDADTGQPIAAASVVARGGAPFYSTRSTVGDASGFYELALPAGVYTLTAGHADYLDRGRAGHVVDQGVTSLLSLNLIGRGRLQGAVADNRGDPLAGAHVVASADAPVAETWTDDAGAYGLLLPRGLYSLAVDAGPGYAAGHVAGLAVTTGNATYQDFTLQAQGVLSGVLSDVRFGSPLPGGLALVEGPVSPALAADGAGRFGAILPTGAYTVTGIYTDYAPSAVAGVAVLTDTTTLLPLALTPVTGALRGAFSDFQTGLPIAGAVASLVNQASGVRVRAASDAAGAFALTAPVGATLLRASHPGYAAETTSLTISHGVTATVAFSLTAGGTLRGVVHSGWNGEPLPGAAIVVLAPAGPLAALTADEAGVYTTTLPVGVYTVTASAPHFLPAVVAGTAVLTGTLVQRDLTLEPALGLLSGAVTSAAGGAPRAGALVQATRAGDGLAVSAMSDPAGVYSLTLPVGGYAVTATLAAHAPATATVTVLTGAVAVHDLALWPLGLLTGQVSAQGGEGLAGALVQASGGPSAPLGATTNAAGAYSITLKVGAYDLLATQAGYLPALRSGVVVTEGAVQRSDFALQGVGSLTGTVRSAQSGSPVPGAMVALAGAQAITLTTDAAGVYSATLYAGDYAVRVSKTWFEDGGLSTVLNAGQTTLLDVTLVALGQLRGAVSDADSDVPLPGVNIQVSDGAGRGWQATTDAAGAYSLTLPAGAYAVLIDEWAYEPVTFSVTVPAGDVVRRDRALDPIAPAPLLVLDDDGGGAEEVAAGSELNALGESYQTWDVAARGAVAGSVLAPYCAVIWLTGDDDQTTFTAPEQTAVAGYLNGALAPHLLVSGDDIGFDLWHGSVGDWLFLSNYLHAYYLNENSTSLAGQGLKFLAGVSFQLYDDGGTGDHGYPSRVYPRSDALDILHYSDGSSAGSAWDGGHQVAYLGFKLSSVTSPAARRDLLGQALYWFGCGAGSCPADVNRDHSVDIADVMQVAGRWGQAYGVRFDVNRDGALDLLDVMATAAAWGTACPTP